MFKRWKRNDEGFTLVEVVVTMVVLSLLVLGVTFTYQNIAKINNISSKKGNANQLSQSLLDQISEVNFSDIVEENIPTMFRYPSYIDTTNMMVTDYRKSATNDVSFKINHLEGNLSDFNVEFNISPASYVTNYNIFKFSLIKYMSNEDAFVVNDMCDTTSWVIDESDSFTQANDLTREYLTRNDAMSYDAQAALAFQIANQSQLYKRYEKWAEELGNNGISYSESPFAELELDTDKIYNLLDKKTTLLVEKPENTIFVKISVVAEYTLNPSYISSLGGYFSTITNFEDLFDGEQTKTITISSQRYLTLNDVYVLYWGTKCKTDNYAIDNDCNLPLNIFFFIETEYNAQEIINGKFGEDPTSQIPVPSNLKAISYTQESPTIDLIKMYTNIENTSVIESMHLVSNIFTNPNYRESSTTVRMYEVSIIVRDEAGHLLLNTAEKTVLGR